MLKIILIIILISQASIILLSAPVCPNQYHCKSSNVSFQDNQCILKVVNVETSTNEFHVDAHVCKKPNQCAISSDSENCTILANLEAGESCATNDNCLSKKCQGDSSKVCVAAKENEVCVSNFDCSNGLYCQQNIDPKQPSVCAKQIIQGNACTSNYDCLNNLFCQAGTLTCVPYFSLSNGTNATNNEMCISGKVDSTTKKCIETTLTSDPICPANTKDMTPLCTYTDQDKTKITDNCHCSYSNTEKTYCPLASTSSDYKAGVEAFKAYLSGNALQRHTTNRFRSDYKTNLKWNGAVQNYFYQDADSCLKILLADSKTLVLSIMSFFAIILLF